MNNDNDIMRPGDLVYLKYIFCCKEEITRCGKFIFKFGTIDSISKTPLKCGSCPKLFGSISCARVKYDDEVALCNWPLICLQKIQPLRKLGEVDEKKVLELWTPSPDGVVKKIKEFERRERERVR